MSRNYLPIVFGIFIISLSITIVGVEISLFLLLTFLLIKYLSTKELSFNQPLFIETLFIPAYALISILISEETISSSMNFSAFWVFLSYPILFLALNHTDLKYIEKALNISIYISVALSIYAIIQHFTGINLFGNMVRHAPDGIRYLSTAHFNKHSTFAFTTTFVIVYTILRIITQNLSIREKIFLSISAIIMLYATIFTYVRAPIITGILASLIVLSFVRKRYILYLIAGLIIVLSTIYFISPSVITKYLESLSSQSESGWQRLFIYKRALEIYADNIGRGIGFGNFTHYTYIYYDQFYKDFQVRCHTHNLFLQYLTEMGVIGFFLISFLMFKFAVLSVSIRNRIGGKREILIYLWGNIVFLIISLSSFIQCTIYDGHIAFFFFFAMALVMNLYSKFKEELYPSNFP